MLLVLDLLADDDDLIFLALAGGEGFWCIPLATTATDHAGQLFVFWHDGRLTVGQAVSPLHVLVEPRILVARPARDELWSIERRREATVAREVRRNAPRTPLPTAAKREIPAPPPRVMQREETAQVVERQCVLYSTAVVQDVYVLGTTERQAVFVVHSKNL